ncbi:MAG: 3-deoxy-7-phosphoheptulonate synthase, partial [Spirochaetes bacterium]|nr:3-deoxy-7-phosphoheptulonate synthase [Spirochaetota bacterium]
MNTGQPQTDPAFSSAQVLPGPAALSAQTALSAAAARAATENRLAILSILQGRDRRLLVIIGPCSVHDPAEALDYAHWLLPFARRMQDCMLIAMRCYVEKSRTGAGWRGLARQPLPAGIMASGAGSATDGSTTLQASPQSGIQAARAFLVQVAELGLPVAVEMVSPFLWPYWSDCVSWASVGARGVESQALREAASALPCACGFKNATDGSIDTALHAIQTAALPGPVLALHSAAADSTLYELSSRGNPCPHLILRGGRQG